MGEGEVICVLSFQILEAMAQGAAEACSCFLLGQANNLDLPKLEETDRGWGAKRGEASQMVEAGRAGWG